jgi:carbon storage regulator CsrA
MLVLSRKTQESVVIGGSDGFERVLKVTVLEISSGKVRLGFEVDQDVPVHRLEVWERIQAGGHPQGHWSAAQINSTDLGAAPPQQNGAGKPSGR